MGACACACVCACACAELNTSIAVTGFWCAKGGLSCKLPATTFTYNQHYHMHLPQPHTYHHHHHHHTVQVAICASGTRKRPPAQVAEVTKTSAGRVFALVAGMKTPPAKVAEGQGDWALASIGASWSGMQQQHATYTWALTCIVVVPMQVALLLHPAPSCADGCWFLVPPSENNLPALVVVTLCNLHWWSFS